jgi:hypothetical protein
LLSIFRYCNVGCIYMFSVVISSWWIDLLTLYNDLLCLLRQYWHKVYFVWCKNSRPCSVLLTIYMEYLFPFSHFQSVCLLKYKVSVVNSILLNFVSCCLGLILVLDYPFSHSMSFGWRIYPFIFKVIISARDVAQW